jgi:tRNA G10  N-methylase Trm11
MYQERDVRERLVAKITRLYKQVPDIKLLDREVLEVDARNFPISKDVQAIVTSPPYMNELDYVRDNRLRLWFIRRVLPVGLELPGRRREEHFRGLLRDVFCRLAHGVRIGGYIVLVLGDVTRRSKATAPDLIARKLFESENELKGFSLYSEFRDLVPDIRRSRRECKGTKIETVLMYKKNYN